MIDEKKLIEELRKYADELITVRGEIELGNGVLKAISIVKKQPKVGEWIPCSERLPELYEEVLIEHVDGHDVCFLNEDNIFVNSKDIEINSENVFWYSIKHVIAWMPINDSHIDENYFPTKEEIMQQGETE